MSNPYIYTYFTTPINTSAWAGSDATSFIEWYLNNDRPSPFDSTSTFIYTRFTTSINTSAWAGSDATAFIEWYLDNNNPSPFLIIPPSTDLPIGQRRLPVPNDLSNSVIFSTNFYSATDLSNITRVPSNLFNSSGNPDISFTLARDFWLSEISNNPITEVSNNGITIITIQNLTQNYAVSAHTLQFLNWDVSANSNYSNYSNNSLIFKGDQSSNLANGMNFISGIRTISAEPSTSVNLPIAITSSIHAPNNSFGFLNVDGISSLTELSNQFLNYIIVLGRPILVNIPEVYDGINFQNIHNLINWRSSSPYGSSANNVWIRNNIAYDSESNGNILPFPLIFIPGVTYTINILEEITINLDNSNDYTVNGSIPNELTITTSLTFRKTVTRNKKMNNTSTNVFAFTDLTSL